MHTLSWLQDWYAAQCNGEWEHGSGIKIETLDNPGWRITVDLKYTELAGKLFQSLQLERSEDDWLRCWVNDDKFEAAGGSKNLEEAISTFRKFATEL